MQETRKGKGAQKTWSEYHRVLARGLKGPEQPNGGSAVRARARAALLSTSPAGAHREWLCGRHQPCKLQCINFSEEGWCGCGLHQRKRGLHVPPSTLQRP
jgi:hypothetical protein